MGDAEACRACQSCPTVDEITNHWMLATPGSAFGARWFSADNGATSPSLKGTWGHISMAPTFALLRKLGWFYTRGSWLSQPEGP